MSASASCTVSCLQAGPTFSVELCNFAREGLEFALCLGDLEGLPPLAMDLPSAALITCTSRRFGLTNSKDTWSPAFTLCASAKSFQPCKHTNIVPH